MKYVAFLRAVNVGGHNKIKMEDLKKLFISIGYKNVKTIIQSGNVIFKTDYKYSEIKCKIEKAIKDKYGFEVIKATDMIEGKVSPDDYKKCVVTIAGSELARGGGGARCMTMPVCRAEVTI